MAGETYIEDMVEGVRDHVNSNIASYLDAIDTAKNDGITLADFQEITLEDGDPLSRNVYPSMMVYATDFRSRAISTEKEQLSVEIVFQLTLRATDNLVTRSLRYLDALRNLVFADETFGGVVDTLAGYLEGAGADSMSGENFPTLDSQFKVTTFRVVVAKDIAV